jgi:uncharacterized protein involved in type VI secretion and phage assembly
MAFGSVAYSSQGFRRFLDDILNHGLEIIGLYYGSYRAEVVSNEDPDQAGQPDPMGRLTVVVPAVDGGSRLTERVAFPITPMAGPGYGFKSLPPVGGYVWVEFERGRVDLPMWKGGWFGDGDIPDDLKPTEAHGWFTPSGHQILMDDQSGSEFIRVKHKNGSTLIEFDSQGSIFITNKSGQKVNIGDGADTANEPALLGTTTKDLISELCDAILALTVSTGMGPSGTPINAAQFAAIKARLQTMLSTTVNVK